MQLALDELNDYESRYQNSLDELRKAGKKSYSTQSTKYRVLGLLLERSLL